MYYPSADLPTHSYTYTYTYTTLIRHASRAGIRSDRFASNSQYARSSLDEQVGLSLPRGCVDSAQQKDISANKQKNSKEKKTTTEFYTAVQKK